MPEKPEIPITNIVLPKTSWLGRHVGTVLTALGLLIAIPTSIELYPRPTPAAGLPTNQNDQLSSSSFTITNDGYARLADVKAVCFLWKVQLNRVANIENDLSRIVSPSEGTLQTNEGITVPCTARSPIGFASGPPRLTKADLAIVVYYRPWPITILRCHRLFRFIARFGSNGDVAAWDKQPSAILERDFDKAMASGQPII